MNVNVERGYVWNQVWVSSVLVCLYALTKVLRQFWGPISTRVARSGVQGPFWKKILLRIGLFNFSQEPRSTLYFLDFDNWSFPIKCFVEKGCSLSFESVKWNSTTVGCRPWKNPLLSHPGKKSFQRLWPCNISGTSVCDCSLERLCTVAVTGFQSDAKLISKIFNEVCCWMFSLQLLQCGQDFLWIKCFFLRIIYVRTFLHRKRRWNKK